MTHSTTANVSMALDGETTPWSAVICMSLLSFLLVGLEFMPASLLTPIAQDLAISEGMAGQAITVSGLFAVVTSLFGNALLRHLDRRNVVLLYTGILTVSSLVVAAAPNFAVFLLGRALVGIAIGGFWSLSTAILARLAGKADLPKAIAFLQGGTAFALVIAAPVGSYLGELIGWRGTFFVTVPIGVVGIMWQLVILPRMPAEEATSTRAMAGLLRNPVFMLGMAGTGLAFMGINALQIYLRPFLETVTALDIGFVSLALLGVGLGGLVGLTLVGFFLRRVLTPVLVGLPLALAVFALLLIAFGRVAIPTGVLLVLWGIFNTPVPVAWNTWMTRVIPHELEAGGGLQVTIIQTSIALGAIGGGLMFDSAGWWSAFTLAATLLIASAIFAVMAAPRD